MNKQRTRLKERLLPPRQQIYKILCLCYQAKLLKQEKVLSKLKYQNAIACCIILT